VAMIETLRAEGHAYAAEGHVLFAVDSWREHYGALSGRSVDDMIAGARVEVAPYKRNPMDFVLWKPSDAQEPGWDSPWGRGRPGWHIECSAMAKALLGDTFDIHGGGNDLMFPHHENEIAQSCCANHTDAMAKIWMHNEMLQVEGKKMSKSLGNFFTVRDLLDQGVPGEVIRFVMLSTHYSKPMDWTVKKAEEARRILKTWFQITDGVEASSEAPNDIINILASDLNTHGVISEMHALANRNDASGLKAAMKLVGFPSAKEIDWFREPMRMASFGNLHDQTGPLWPLLERWQQLRNERNFGEADALKARIEASGLKLSVGVAGPDATATEDFDPAKLEGLL
jgi:cysteinyl-tRNA synthetase